MATFMLTPGSAAGALVEQTPTAALHTVLQINVPTASFISIYAWGISYTGTVAADAPGQAYLMEGDVAASVGTAQTPFTYGEIQGAAASVCVGGTALSGYAFGTENTITASRFFDVQKLHPQTGYSVWFPPDARPRCGQIASARFVRIRVVPAVAYALIPWIVWSE